MQEKNRFYLDKEQKEKKKDLRMENEGKDTKIKTTVYEIRRKKRREGFANYRTKNQRKFKQGRNYERNVYLSQKNTTNERKLNRKAWNEEESRKSKSNYWKKK